VPDDVKSYLMVIVVGLLSAVGGGWFATQTATVEVEPDYVKILQDELRASRSELAQEQARNLTLTLQMADLERELGGSSVASVESKAVFAFLNRIERSAWCKRVKYDEEPSLVTFIMAFLNHAYELKYGVSAARYIGKTDFDIYPPAMADRYYQNDMQSYVTRDYFEFSEKTVAGAGMIRFAKWWVQIPSGTEYICGLEVG
jgi:hypothetical protein